MDDSTNSYIKGAVEALLFINEKPVTLDQLRSALESVGGAEIKKAIAELMHEYGQEQGDDRNDREHFE